MAEREIDATRACFLALLHLYRGKVDPVTLDAHWNFPSRKIDPAQVLHEVELAVRENRELFFTFAASGFRDFTRIAASHPEMWRDICLANREALLLELDSYRAQLDDLRSALERADGQRLEEVFDTARTARRAWAEGKF